MSYNSTVDTAIILSQLLQDYLISDMHSHSLFLHMYMCLLHCFICIVDHLE